MLSVALLDHPGHASLQRLQSESAAVLDLQLEPARAAQAVHRRSAEDADPGFLDLLEIGLAQPGQHRVGAQFGLAGAFLERLEDDKHASRIGDVVAGQHRVAGQADDVGDGIFLGKGNAAHPGHDRVGPLQAGPIGKLGVDHEVALVLLGDESGRNDLEPDDCQGQQPAVDQQHDGGDSQDAPNQPCRNRWRGGRTPS